MVETVLRIVKALIASAGMPTRTHLGRFGPHRNRTRSRTALRQCGVIDYDQSVVTRALIAMAVGFACLTLSTSARCGKFRVRARPDFYAVRTEAHPAGARVTGSLRDETQTPLPGRPVTLQAAGVVATDCESGAVQAVTDERGRFCFLLRGGLPDRAVLAHAMGDYLEPVSKSVALEPSAPELSVQLEVDTATWNVDGGPQVVRISLLSDNGSNESHPLQLRFDQNDSSRMLAVERIASTRRAVEIELDPAQLGQPGPATLTAVVGDDPSQPLALRSLALVLSATVSLNWSEPLEPVRPELGFDVALEARSRLGPADSGWVEIGIGDARVGTAQVMAGRAVVPCRFMTTQRRGVSIHARYVSEHPWLTAGDELSAELIIAEVPWWWHVPWLAAGALAAIWIVRAWRRPARSIRPGVSPPRPTEPGVRVMEAGRAQSGWRGWIVDAHSGAPIPNASLRVVIPSIETAAAAAHIRSDEKGGFRLPQLDTLPEGARWVVEAAHHSTLTQAVPPYGTLQIALCSRRRTLLSHLLRWADERGWSKGSTPTPADLVRTAQEQQDATVEAWAGQIEEAVFGREAPNADREARLTQERPPLRRM